MAVFEVISGCHEMKSNEVKCFCFLLGTLVKVQGGGTISVFATSILLVVCSWDSGSSVIIPLPNGQF